MPEAGPGVTLTLPGSGARPPGGRPDDADSSFAGRTRVRALVVRRRRVAALTRARGLVAALPLLLAGACGDAPAAQRPPTAEAGWFEVRSVQGATLGRGDAPSVARVDAGSLTVELSGNWTAGQGSTVFLAYRNRGDATATVAFDRARLVADEAATPLRVLVGPPDGEAQPPDPDAPATRNQGPEGLGSFALPPGDGRDVVLEYGPLGRGSPAENGRVTLELPIGREVARVSLRYVGARADGAPAILFPPNPSREK